MQFSLLILLWSTILTEEITDIHNKLRDCTCTYVLLLNCEMNPAPGSVFHPLDYFKARW